MLRAHPRHDRRRTRPTIEGLEDRKLLYATLGAGWANPGRITFSFAPDGTNIGGAPSAMFQAMSNRGFTASQWELAFQKAANAWAATTNLNLALVADDGSSFGVAGNQQGDPRFGDIRIGGTPLASGSLAGTFLPPPYNGGTLAGDMVVNTAQLWQINNDYDLQTVAIHEFGHALGMDHSAISTACMYASYTSMKQTLSSDDTAGIRSIYGARAIDAFDAAASNSAYNRASDLTSYLDANARVTLTGLDITQTTDLDWYVVTAPANSGGTMTVTMQSSDFSTLSPRLEVFNGALQSVSLQQAPGSYGATLTTSPLANAGAGQKFYIKCSSASAGSAGIGAYGLQISFGAGGMAQVTTSQAAVSQGMSNPIPAPIAVVASAPDQGGGSASEVVGGRGRGIGGRGAVEPGDSILIGNLLAVGDTFRTDGLPPSRARGRDRMDDGRDGIADLGATWSPLAPPPAPAAESEAPDGVVGGRHAAPIRAIDALLDAWDKSKF